MSSGSSDLVIMVIDNDRDIAELEISVLEAEGYKGLWVAPMADIAAEADRSRLALIIVDLNPMTPEPYDILDLLRASTSTQGIPVLATSTARNLADGALASYNVRTVLEKPFELDQFLEKVREALGREPLRAELSLRDEAWADDAVGQAARVVTRQSREALFRWVQKLRSQSPWRERDDLSLGQVLNSVPVLVEALGIALQYGSVDELLINHDESKERVCEHARLRRQQGFSLTHLIQEYDLLRDELMKMMERHLSPRITAQEAFQVGGLLNQTLDRIIDITIPAFEETPGP